MVELDAAGHRRRDRQNPYVDALMVNTGGGGGRRREQRPFNVQLTPRAAAAADRRSRSRSSCAARSGASRDSAAFVNVPAALQIGGFRGNSNYNMNVQSLNYDELYKWAPVLEGGDRAQLPEVQDVSDNMELKSPRVNMTIDRDKAAAVGLNATQITQNAVRRVRPAAGRRRSTATRTQYRVLLELDPKYQERRRIAEEDLVQDAAAAALVPLESVVNFKEDVGPQSVNHFGQLPAVNDLVRPEAGRLARRRRSITSTQVADQRAAGDGDDELPGIGEGVPGSRCRNLSLLLLHRDRRRLHRARHAVRELHPSAHDSLRPAVGGLGGLSRCGCSATS